MLPKVTPTPKLLSNQKTAVLVFLLKPRDIFHQIFLSTIRDYKFFVVVIQCRYFFIDLCTLSFKHLIYSRYWKYSVYIASFLKDVLHYNGTNRTYIYIYKLKQSETCHKRAPKIKVCERSLPAGERASKILCKQDTRNM